MKRQILRIKRPSSPWSEDQLPGWTLHTRWRELTPWRRGPRRRKAVGTRELCGPEQESVRRQASRLGVRPCAAPCGPGPSFTISLLKRASAEEHVVRWASRLSQRKADKTGKWLQRPPSDSHELLVPQAWGVLAKKNCQVQGHEASAP